MTSSGKLALYWSKPVCIKGSVVVNAIGREKADVYIEDSVNR